jgi:hypothetical protein
MSTTLHKNLNVRWAPNEFPIRDRLTVSRARVKLLNVPTAARCNVFVTSTASIPLPHPRGPIVFSSPTARSRRKLKRVSLSRLRTPQQYHYAVCTRICVRVHDRKYYVYVRTLTRIYIYECTRDENTRPRAQFVAVITSGPIYYTG